MAPQNWLQFSQIERTLQCRIGSHGGEYSGTQYYDSINKISL